MMAVDAQRNWPASISRYFLRAESGLIRVDYGEPGGATREVCWPQFFYSAGSGGK